MSQKNDDHAGGGCFACFGGKKNGGRKKTQNTSSKQPVVTSEPKPVEKDKPQQDPQVDPEPKKPPPDFITQVDKDKGNRPMKISVAPPKLSRDEIDINSPRSATNHENDKVRYSSKSNENDNERVPWRPDALLPPQRPNKQGLKCLVLDLDETLVHSSFKEVPVYDFLVPVEIEGTTYQVYVAKRPGVDEFLKKMGECYEIVVFTASLAKYADPVLDLLDIHKVVDWRLFRESCTCIKNTYVKDMGRLGRPLKSVMIMDNSPHSYSFNPENAIPCESWFDDYTDTELLRFIPVLQDVARPQVDNVIVELERLKMNGVQRLLESMESSSVQSDSSAYSIESEISSSGSGS